VATNPPEFTGDTGVAARPNHRNGLGRAALILGIIALVLFWLWFIALPLGLVALVLGIAGHRRAKRGEATNKGTSIVGAVIGLLAVLISGALLALGVAFLTSDSGKDYQSCMKNADTKSQRDQCAKDFGRKLTD
jgi:hypothetical protein